MKLIKNVKVVKATNGIRKVSGIKANLFLVANKIVMMDIMKMKIKNIKKESVQNAQVDVHSV